jgi:uncharacterized protein (TIGR02391 family)
MPNLQQLVPEVETLLALDPEELGVLLLRVLADRPRFHPGGVEENLFSGSPPEYSRDRRDEVAEAVREAFAWLNGQALLIEADPSNPIGWKKISRRGRRLLSQAGGEEYKAASLLPRKVLHPKIADNVYFNFQRGDYQTAVSLAFRTVEIAVREKSGFEEVGVKLMRAAFHKDTGPLRDPDAEEGEREARAHLFAGAFGSCRNPHSHRDIVLKAEDAVHMLVLASYLLRVVDTAGTR